MAGTVTITSDSPLKDVNKAIIGRRILIAATGDSADGSYPALTLKRLNGFLTTFITNPGSTAPTDNYDVALYHPSDSTADVLGGRGADRDTTNTELAPVARASDASDIYLNGNYSLAITGNSVNSATIAIVMEMLIASA